MSRDDQQQVACRRPHLLSDCPNNLDIQVARQRGAHIVRLQFRNRRARLRIQPNRGQSSRALPPHDLRQVLKLPPTVSRAAGRDNSPHHAAGFSKRRREDRDAAIAHDAGNIRNLHAESQVRLVGAEALHRLLIRHARKRGCHSLVRRGRVGEARVQFLHQIEDVGLLDETHLEVQLSELRLTIGPQVLIPETSRDLEIAFDARHHQQLLELLRRLRERVEMAGVDARWHKIVSCTLRRALHQHGRLDFQEVAGIEEIADILHDLVPQRKVRRHPLSPQIEVAITEPQRLIDVRFLIDVERRRL